MKPFTLPAWTRKLPDNAFLNSKEVAVIFGYTDRCNITQRVKDGLVPAPDQQTSAKTIFKCNRLGWSMGGLRKMEKEHAKQAS